MNVSEKYPRLRYWLLAAALGLVTLQVCCSTMPTI